MCGVAGILGVRPGGEDLGRLVEGMAGRLAHRGPDDRGAWSDPEAGIALGHTRLSILDLSPAGHQPMLSRCGRYVISFNGEIYNFRALRSELERAGDVFRGSSDTEVLLAAVSRWGLFAALERSSGMFAVALWDREARRLQLARDRFGEKPMYWARIGKGIAFASELKAFQALPGFSPRISGAALTQLLRYKCIPSPLSVYEDVWKVDPGEILAFSAGSGGVEAPDRLRYWDPGDAAARGRENPFTGSFPDAVDALRGLLRESVGQQMVADVPLGAFLSGGTDSSLITALMRTLSPAKVKTFSIGFDWEEFDETAQAKEVADRLGTEHSELYVTSRDALELIPRLPGIYDEPFADSSQVPTCILSRMAREEVTVALTGDGADELFFGYTRYRTARKLWPWLSRVPPGARRALRDFAASRPRENAGSTLEGLLPGGLRGGLARLRGRSRLLMEVGGFSDARDFYLGLVSEEKDPGSLLALGRTEGRTRIETADAPPFPGIEDLMMHCDILQYLPDDILVKVDRASMAASLETRVPFLDHRLCEFAWTLPLEYKYDRRLGGKRILKELLADYLPWELIDRPKRGFGVPLARWLRGPLRDWAESLLDEDRLRRDGFLKPAAVRRLWEGFLRESIDPGPTLWTLLMFQAWLESAGARFSVAPPTPALSSSPI